MPNKIGLSSVRCVTAAALLFSAWCVQAAQTVQLSADCGTTPRVFALPGAFSVASDCRDSTTPPAPALPYDHRIYASAAAARLAGLEPVDQRRPGIAQMEPAGRAGRKAQDGRHGQATAEGGAGQPSA